MVLAGHHAEPNPDTVGALHSLRSRPGADAERTLAPDPARPVRRHALLGAGIPVRRCGGRPEPPRLRGSPRYRRTPRRWECRVSTCSRWAAAWGNLDRKSTRL